MKNDLKMIWYGKVNFLNILLINLYSFNIKFLLLLLSKVSNYFSVF